jgi:hypothetical protein
MGARALPLGRCRVAGCYHPGLLAEMLPTVTVPPGAIPLPLYDRYGLGLLETETPAGRLVGMVGGIPGFLSIALSTYDGRRQLGVMINVLVASVLPRRPAWARTIDGASGLPRDCLERALLESSEVVPLAVELRRRSMVDQAASSLVGVTAVMVWSRATRRAAKCR